MEKKKSMIQVIAVALVFFGLALWAWFKPADAFSATERRSLKQFPEVSVKSVLEGKFMEQFESYTLDQFPMRDAFRGIKAATQFYVFRQSDNNDVYMADGFISKLDYPLSEKALAARHKETRVRPDFCGWSALGPLALFLENVIGIYKADAFENKVYWALPEQIVGKLGIRNYSFGDVVTDLVYENGFLNTVSNQPYTLLIKGLEIAVPAGEQKIKL